MDLGEKVAKAILEVGAFQVDTKNKFEWSSAGSRMPVYTDIRLLFGNPKSSKLILESFLEVMSEKKMEWDIIAGTATAGISPARDLAFKTESDFFYVRNRPKAHGLNKMIECMNPEHIERRKVILIEDTISTGNSLISAVKEIRDRDVGGICTDCLAIFDYRFRESKTSFEYLNPTCEINSLVTYDTLVDVAKKTGYIDSKQVEVLESWHASYS